MRKNLFLVLMCILTVLFVSCDKELAEEPKTVSISAANLTKNEMPVSVTANTTIELNGVNLADGVYISSVSQNSTSKSLRYEDISSDTKGHNDSNQKDNLFKTKQGDYFVIPDEKNNSSFKGSDVDIVGESNIYIRKYEVSDDFKISYDEYPNLTMDVCDEFYYYNFSEHPEIDKSRVIVLGTQTAAISTYEVVQYGFNGDNVNGIFNFNGYDGFGLYAYVAWNGDSYNQDNNVNWQWTYSVMNPISLKDAVGNSITINAGEHVVVDMDMQENQYYKVVLNLSSINEAERGMCYERLIANIESRNYDGSPRNEVMIPEVSDDQTTITLYTGKLDDWFLFNIDLSKVSTGSITCTVQDTDEESTPKFNDLALITADGDYEFKKTGTARFQTFAYKSSVKDNYAGYPAVTSGGTFSNYMRGQYCYSNGYISFDENNKMGLLIEDTTATGFCVIDTGVPAAVADGETAMTVKATPAVYITSAHIKYNPDTDRYESQVVGDSSYWEYSDFFNMSNTSFKPYCFGTVNVKDNTGKVVESYEVRTGSLNGFRFETEEGALDLSTSENINDTEGRYGMLCFSDQNVNMKVRLIFDEGWFEKGNDGKYRATKLNLILSLHLDPSAPTDEFVEVGTVTFEYRHVHEWEFDEKTGLCECECGEERAYTYRYINPEQSKVTTSGLKDGDKVECVVQRLEYSQEMSNGLTVFPPLETRELVCFVGPTKDCKLSLTGNSVNYNLTVKY